MNKPQSFTTIYQPIGSYVCGAAVCAMATSQTLDQVLSQVDWRKLSFVGGIVEYLASFGIMVGTFFADLDPRNGEWSCLMKPEDHVALVSVKSTQNFGHWVLWDGQQFRDPLGTMTEFKVVEFFPLIYLGDRPAWIDLLPTDWQKFGDIQEVFSHLASER